MWRLQIALYEPFVSECGQPESLGSIVLQNDCPSGAPRCQQPSGGFQDEAKLAILIVPDRPTGVHKHSSPPGSAARFEYVDLDSIQPHQF